VNDLQGACGPMHLRRFSKRRYRSMLRMCRFSICNNRPRQGPTSLEAVLTGIRGMDSGAMSRPCLFGLLGAANGEATIIRIPKRLDVAPPTRHCEQKNNYHSSLPSTPPRCFCQQKNPFRSILSVTRGRWLSLRAERSNLALGIAFPRNAGSRSSQL
jgi:hypothetical protein